MDIQKIKQLINDRIEAYTDCYFEKATHYTYKELMEIEAKMEAYMEVADLLEGKEVTAKIIKLPVKAPMPTKSKYIPGKINKGVNN